MPSAACCPPQGADRAGLEASTEYGLAGHRGCWLAAVMPSDGVLQSIHNEDIDAMKRLISIAFAVLAIGAATA